jgi:Fe-S cluster biosynthesis and repair protein YggX
MSPLQESIERYRKMAQDDPDNELGHFRLGKALVEAGQYADAVPSLRRTLELNPDFSKVFELLGTCLLKIDRRAEALEVLRQGYTVAEARGDNVPRDAMAQMLRQLGEAPPAPKAAPAAAAGDGFRCQRPGCPSGTRARQLPKPPINDELGQRIYATVCAACWDEWLRNYSIKVINELRLDLSTTRGQEVYDQVMREFLGLE